MRKVYRMEYYEPYEPDFKYEAQFGLGYYESRERCMKEIEAFYKHLPGFRDGSFENYRIRELIMDDIITSDIIGQSCDKMSVSSEKALFYELIHGYETKDEFRVCTVMGVYSKKEWAEIMKKKFENWTIFKMHDDPELGFFVDPIWLNRHLWDAGFDRFIPSSKGSSD